MTTNRPSRRGTGSSLAAAFGATLDRVLTDEGALDAEGVEELDSAGWFEFYSLAWVDRSSADTVEALDALQEGGHRLLPPAALVHLAFTRPLLDLLAARAGAAPGHAAALAAGPSLCVPVPTLAPDLRWIVTGPAAVSDGAPGWRVTGRTVQAAPQTVAAFLVSLPLADGTALALLPTDRDGLAVERAASLVPGAEVLSVRFDDVQITEGDLIARECDSEINDAGQALSLALDAHCVGICEEVLARTLAHIKSREQFGVPLRSFQSVRHLAADMKVSLELARSLLEQASTTRIGDAPDREKLVASRLTAARAARTVCEFAIQLHGGIGFTWESGLHLWYRHALLLSEFVTDVVAVEAVVARHLLEPAASTAGTS